MTTPHFDYEQTRSNTRKVGGNGRNGKAQGENKKAGSGGSKKAMEDLPKEKKCPRCNHKKPITDFGSKLGTRDGLSSWCLLCKARDTRDRNKRHPENKKAFDRNYRAANRDLLNHKDRQRYYDHKLKTRNNNLKLKYGIGNDEYLEMLLKQECKCASCRTETPGTWHTKFCIDHCHKTGKIRGLLCSKCNLALGYLDDSPEKIKSLLAYISR